MEENDIGLKTSKDRINVLNDINKYPAFVQQQGEVAIMKNCETVNENESKLALKCQQLQSKLSSMQFLEDKNILHSIRDELENEMDPDDIGTTENATKSHDIQTIELRDLQEMWDREKQSLQNELDTTKKIIKGLEIEKFRLEQEKKELIMLLDEKNEKIKQLETRNKKAKTKERISDELRKIEQRLGEMEKELLRKDQHIEELLNEDIRNRKKIENMEREILELKNINYRNSLSSDGDDAATYTLTKEKCSCKRHKELEKNLLDMIARDRVISSQLKQTKKRMREKNDLLLKEQHSNKILTSALTEKTESEIQLQKENVALHKELEGKSNLISQIKIESDIVKSELNKKNDYIEEIRASNETLKSQLDVKSNSFKDMSTKCQRLSENVNKSLRTIKELESIREKYVSDNGNLEEKVCELKKELAEYKHPRYPEIIDSLKKEIVSLTKEKNELKNMHVKISEENALIAFNVDKVTDRCLYNIGEAFKIMDAIPESTAAFERNESGKHDFDTSADERYDLVAMVTKHLQTRVGNLVTYCTDLQEEKAKLSNELAFSKERMVKENNAEENTTKPDGNLLEIEKSYIELKNETQQEQSDSIFNITSSQNDSDIESNKSLQESIKTKACRVYEAYISSLVENSLDENSTEDEDHRSESKIQEQEMASFRYQTSSYASSDASETLTNVTGSESQVDLDLRKNRTKKLVENKEKNKPSPKRSFRMRQRHQAKAESVSGASTIISASEDTINSKDTKNSEKQAARGKGNSSSKSIFKMQNSSSGQTTSSRDLNKYRSELKMKQKKLDLMAAELDGRSSSFNIRNGLRGNDKEKPLTVKKMNLLKS